jgi:hypothetical protein
MDPDPEAQKHADSAEPDPDPQQANTALIDRLKNFIFLFFSPTYAAPMKAAVERDDRELAIVRKV